MLCMLCNRKEITCQRVYNSGDRIYQILIYLNFRNLVGFVPCAVKNLQNELTYRNMEIA